VLKHLIKPKENIMKDKLKISESVQAKVNEITSWCLSVNRSTFQPFFDFQAHVCLLDLRIYIDGYENNKGNIKKFGCYLNESNGGSDISSIKNLDDMFDRIKELEEESGIKWSDENVELHKLSIAQKDLKKAEKTSARLKAEIEAMEAK
jgi:hypothetical protein